jgi:cell division protein ZapD
VNHFKPHQFSVILYEYPLHERIRTYLRLEHLFVRLHQLATRIDDLDHHFALVTLFEIMEVAARADLKSDLLKDLDRQRHTLDAYRGNPAIAETVVNSTSALSRSTTSPAKPASH